MRLSVSMLDHTDPLIYKNVESFDFGPKFMVICLKTGDLIYLNMDRIVEMWVLYTDLKQKIAFVTKETASEQQPKLPYSS